MIRVNDLQKSINFYPNFLGKKLPRQKDKTDTKFTLMFVGYGDESDTMDDISATESCQITLAQFAVNGRVE